MTVQPRLQTLKRQAIRRLDRLSWLYSHALSLPREEIDRITAFVVIETFATWASYCRFFFLSSALGARDGSGKPVLRHPSRLPSTDAALTRVIHQLRPNLRSKAAPWAPRDEPAWQDPATFSKTMRLISASNASQVARAVSGRTGALRELPTFRNFYAHRSHGAVAKTRTIAHRYRLPADQHPTTLLSSFPPSASERLLIGWLADLRAVVDLTV